MNVREKLLIIMSAIFISLISVFIALSIFFGLANYEHIELNQAEKGLIRIENALEREYEELDRMVSDWSSWDDTYTFVETRSQEYIDSNLIAETYQTLHVDFIVYLNRDAEVVYGNSFSAEYGLTGSIPASLLAHLRAEDPLVATPLNYGGVSGIISLKEGDAIVSARPILTSRGEGPVNGVLIMGRFLDNEDLAHMSEITEYELRLLKDLPDWQGRVHAYTGDDHQRYVLIPEGMKNLEAFTTVRDIYGAPAFTLANTLEREIYAEGIASVTRLILYGLALALLLGIATLAVLERFVLVRLARLDNAIRTITPEGELRIDLDGDDEFSRLAMTISEMLARLHESRNRLSASEKRYHAVVESQTELIARFEPSGRLKFANMAFLKFFGMKEGEAEVQRLVSYIHPGDLPTLKEHFRSFTLDEPLKRIVHRILLPEGTVRWVEWTDLAIFDEQGRIIEFQSVGRDITERKIAEERIRDLNRRLNDIIESLPDATFVLDKEMRVVAWNREMERIFGVRKEQVLGRGVQECERLLDEVNAGYLLHLLSDSGQSEDRFEHLRRDKDAIYAETKKPLLVRGKMIYVWIKISPLIDASGARSGYIGSIRDITERKLAERSIAQANTKLKLLSSLTRHDILNGLNALKFYLECASEGIRGAEAQYIEKGHQVLNMIRSMIEFTRDYQEIGVRAPNWQQVGSVLESVKAQISLEGIRFTCETGDLWIYADSMLGKVFYNLVDNSIRHGEHVRQISLTIENAGDGIDLVYSDDGMGIPDTEKELIFKQGHGKNTGFGLFLSRQILSITGLTISEHGTYGKGARFVIHAPPGTYRFGDGSGSEKNGAVEQS